MLELFRPVHRVNRNDNRIGAQNRKVCHHPLWAVLHVEHHPVAFFYPHARQRRGQCLGLGQHITVGKYAIKKDQRRLVRKAQRIDRQVVPQRRGGCRDVAWNTLGPNGVVALVRWVG